MIPYPAWSVRRRAITFIALSEIVGGVLALGGYGVDLWRHTVIPAWSYAGGISLALAVIATGSLLYKGHAWGYGLSLLFQTAQVFQFNSSTFVFQIVLGPMVTVDVGESGLGTHVGIFGTTAVWRAPGESSMPQPPSSVAFNIVATGALLFLWRQSRRVFSSRALTPTTGCT